MGSGRVAGHVGGPAGAGGVRWWLGETDAPPAVILIRLVVGGIFVSEGIQKFVFPTELGPGRFAKQTPLPAPEVFAYLTGGFEIACGVLLVVGLLTRRPTRRVRSWGSCSACSSCSRLAPDPGRWTTGWHEAAVWRADKTPKAGALIGDDHWRGSRSSRG